jgi:hypothetical protein
LKPVGWNEERGVLVQELLLREEGTQVGEHTNGQ